MAGKLKYLFRDFLLAARKLWLEMMGALFLALAVMFTLNTISEYRKTVHVMTSWDLRTIFSVFGSGILSVLLLVFSLQSFWKARNIR